MSGITAGDRVKFLRPDTVAISYLQPFRRWIEQGRGATVVSVDSRGQAMVQFDCARPPKRPSDYCLRGVWVGDLELCK